ncbi:MAG: ribosome small subunit-dependent GTPase A [Actinobacteria bacterium]|nr:MAG: ribosome small subunit-dependent GTPase A [Actinomycetota bacterium]
MLTAPLHELGWDDRWASQLDALDDEQLVGARVAAQHRGAYVLWTELGELHAELSGKLRHDLDVGADAPAVGDWVAARAHASGTTTIQSVLRRRTAFARKENLGGSIAQVLAANVDTIFVVTGLGEDLSARRVERYLTMAWESGAQPVVVLTKADLGDIADAMRELQAVAVGTNVHAVSNVTGDGLDDLRSYLAPATTAVMLGSSGVGKSSLLNSLAGTELMATKEVAADGTGRHTTTHRELLRLPDGAFAIDTPGLREIQLFTAGEGFDSAFDDLEALAGDCRFTDCAHLHEPGCAVLAAVDEGTLALDRLRSWRKLQRELESIAARSDRRLREARKRRWKEHTRSIRKPKW